MVQSFVSPATIAGRIRSIAIKRGFPSITTRILPESIDPVATRLSHTLNRNPTDDEIISALHRFAEHYPIHFRTADETMRDAREACYNEIDVAVSDVDREVLALLTPAERLDFANGGGLPKRVRRKNTDEK